jgi:hypothetical protein
MDLNKVTKLANLIKQADAMIVADSPLLMGVYYDAEVTNNPENELFCFTWESEGMDFQEIITEEDLDDAEFESNVISVKDENDEYFDIQLFKLAKLVDTES